MAASAQTERELAELEQSDLMKVEIQSVFGASMFLQKNGRTFRIGLK